MPQVTQTDATGTLVETDLVTQLNRHLGGILLGAPLKPAHPEACLDHRRSLT